jgi:uncharacterized protein (TIGR02145 family)
MRKRTLINFVVFAVLSSLLAFQTMELKSHYLIIDDEVKIGNHIWMSRNLNVDRFRNGDLIPLASTNEEWLKAADAKQPAYCYYKNNPENGKSFGKLYNRYAIDDPRGLAPSGWHVSLDEEWRELAEISGGYINLGLILKSEAGWNDNGNGKNNLGFSALPGGLRQYEGDFVGLGDEAGWWTGADQVTTGVWKYSLSSYDNDLSRTSGWEITGMSVRCVKN